MAYLTKEELSTHIYTEIVDVITRTDDDVVDNCISMAIAEAKMYLSRFDLVKLFGAGNTAPTVTDDALKGWVKDIACWKLIKLANPNIDLALFKTCYDQALQSLKDIQSGKADPGWPYPADNPDTTFNEGSNLQWSSNTKRNNHW